MENIDFLKSYDPQVGQAMQQELDRQQQNIELIASENIVSEAVLKAMGSVLTNKYAEGYPGKRYYGGCQYVDIVENIAIERAKQVFGAEHVNVQPHSGAQANMAVYFAFLKPGDTIMGMNLAHGGHLTHGSPVNMSCLLYTSPEEPVIKKLAEKAYRACDCKGLARVDFMIDRKTRTVYLNEINTMPGFTAISMYPKLFENSGLESEQLVEKLISLALDFS